MNRRRLARSVLTMSVCAALGFSAALMLGGAPSPDQPDNRQTVALDALPAAVKKSIETHAPEATLNHAWKLTENDTTFYLVRGKAKDGDKVEFKTVESGRLVEVLHDMPVDRLPADIVDQVKKLVPGGTITMGDRHMAIRWKITVKDGDKTKEVVLRADGKHAVMDAPVQAPVVVPVKPAGK